MPKCLFSSCPHFLGKNCFSPGITLHVFPRDRGRIKLWLQQIGQNFDDIDDFAEKILSSKIGSYRMCSAHFLPECYMSQGTKVVLKPDAVPTLFPGNVVEVAIKHVPQKKKQRLEEKEAGRRTRRSQVDAGTSTIHILHTEMGTQTDLTMVTIQPCPVSVPHRNTTDRGIQWPEYEFNFYGEDWKVQMDHVYFNRRFKGIQELPSLDQEEVIKDHCQAPAKRKRPDSTPEDYRVTQPEALKVESEPCPSPETPEGYFFSKSSFRNKKTLCVLQTKLVALLRHMTEAPHVGSYKRHRTRKLLSQIVDIVCLVAGEDLKLVKKNEDLSKFYQQEGEIPVRYQDVAVFFTRDEWNYIEKNEELYKKEILSDPNEAKEDHMEDFIDDFKEGVEITDDHFFKLLEVNSQGHSPGVTPLGRKKKNALVPTMPGIPDDPDIAEEDDGCLGPLDLDAADEETARNNKDMKPRVKVEACAAGNEDPGEENSGALQPLGPDISNEETVSSGKVLKSPVYKIEDCSADESLTMAPVGLFIYFQSAHTPMHKRRKKLLLPSMPSIEEDNSDGEEQEDTEQEKNKQSCKSQYLSGDDDARKKDGGCVGPLDAEVSGGWSTADSLPDAPSPMLWIAEDGTTSTQWMPQHSVSSASLTVKKPKVHQKQFPKRPVTPPDTGGIMQDTPHYGTEQSKVRQQNSLASDGGGRPSQGMFWCDVCRKCFHTVAELDTHRVTHGEEIPLRCEDCAKVFDARSDLEKHRAKEHGKLRYPCELCGLQYNYRSQYIIHRRTHTGEKPFCCKECGQAFGHKCSLLIHMRKHSASSLFECGRCGKLLDTEQALEKHRKLRFCVNCKKCFTRRALRRHVKNHMPDEITKNGTS